MMRLLVCLPLLVLAAGCADKDKFPVTEQLQDTELSQQAKISITAVLEAAQTDPGVTPEAAATAIANIESYDRAGWFRHWGLCVLLCCYVVGVVCLFEKDGKRNPKPLNLWRVYLGWLLGGWWGAQWNCFYSERKYQSSGRMRVHTYQYISPFLGWLATSIALFIFCVCMNWTAINYLYDTPQLWGLTLDTWGMNIAFSQWNQWGCWILIILFLCNWVGGLILIPWLVYSYNARYFRIDPETDDIMRGQPLYAEDIIDTLDKRLPHLEQIASEVVEAVGNGYSEDDPDEDTGFFASIGRGLKNIATLGGSGSLRREQARLRGLVTCLNKLQRGIDPIEDWAPSLDFLLAEMRQGAYRDLYLAKELIGIVKDNVKGQSQNVKTDFALDMPQTSNIGDVTVASASADFDTEGWSRNFGENCALALDSISYGVSKNPSMKELGDSAVIAGAELAVSAAVDTIAGVIDLWESTSAAREQVAQQTEQVLDALEEALNEVGAFEGELLRRMEILSALAEAHKAFVQAYEPLRAQVFGKPSLGQFLGGVKKNRPVFRTEGFRRDLQHLVQVCSEYNKINQAEA